MMSKTKADLLRESIDKTRSVLAEGRKRFYRQDNIGMAKYTVSYHDGVSKHNDGSDFYGIAIFKNKRDLDMFTKTLLKSGYIEQSGYEKE